MKKKMSPSDRVARRVRRFVIIRGGVYVRNEIKCVEITPKQTLTTLRYWSVM
jgi:hypothetical protein